jgi:hypothetical protein
MEGRFHGLIQRIGDGKSTEIWNMNWIPRDSNMRHPQSYELVPILKPPFLISELITADMSWNRDKLKFHVLQ